MRRDEQMMNAAEAYAEEIGYKDDNDMCCTMNNFCAGWYAADRCSQWIPVEERLPEKEEENPSLSVNVIVTDGNSVFESYYSFNTHIWAGTDIYGTITHWMSMPMPPQPNKKDEKGWIPAPSGNPA